MYKDQKTLNTFEADIIRSAFGPNSELSKESLEGMIADFNDFIHGRPDRDLEDWIEAWVRIEGYWHADMPVKSAGIKSAIFDRSHRKDMPERARLQILVTKADKNKSDRWDYYMLTGYYSAHQRYTTYRSYTHACNRFDAVVRMCNNRGYKVEWSVDHSAFVVTK